MPIPPADVLKIQGNALTISVQVWNDLRLGNPAPTSGQVSCVYQALLSSSLFSPPNLRTPQNELDVFLQPGNFLHLVKQVVMTNVDFLGFAITADQSIMAVSNAFNRPVAATGLTGFQLLIALIVDIYGSPNPDLRRPIDPNSQSGPIFGTVKVTPFTYTINYQNTGNAPTNMVTVTQTVNAGLDVTSIGGYGASDVTQTNLDGLDAGVFPDVVVGNLGAASFPNNSGVTVALTLLGGNKVKWVLTLPAGIQPQQGGSFSYLISPKVLPPTTTAYPNNISMPAATIVFGGAGGAKVNTNGWP